MCRARLRAILCSLLACTLLGATSQYLAHFHVSPAQFAQAAPGDVSGSERPDTTRESAESCDLCLQFARLPAPPNPLRLEPAHFYLVGGCTDIPSAVWSPSLVRLWPPARAPPVNS